MKLSKSLPALLAFAVVAGASFANAAVWPTTRQWDDAAENEYHQWVEKNWKKDFMAGPGYYKDLKMDCADAVYTMRLIFAAERGLPFVMKDPTGGSKTISNEMTRWDKLPSDQRKRKFMEYIFDVASTSSLPSDTYPVAVNRDAIGAGRLILTDSRSHHSWTVQRVMHTGIPFLLFASRPARVVMTERPEYPSMKFTFVDGLRPERHAGFRNFRQPKDIGKKVVDVPGYSLEQYRIPWERWHSEMQRRLQTRSETPDERVERVLSVACRGASERVEYVNQALDYQRKIGSRCMNAQEYDDYSSPSKDGRLKANFEDVQLAFRETRGQIKSEKLRQQLASVVVGDDAAGPSAYCQIEIKSGRKLSLGQVSQRSLSNRLSPNPNDGFNERWGLAPYPGERARNCPNY